MIKTIPIKTNSLGGNQISIIDTEDNILNPQIKQLCNKKSRGVYIWTYKGSIKKIKKEYFEEDTNRIIYKNDEYIWYHNSWLKCGQYGQNTYSISPIDTISNYSKGQLDEIVIIYVLENDNPYEIEQKAWHQNPNLKKIIDGKGTEKIDSTYKEVISELHKVIGNISNTDFYRNEITLLPHQEKSQIKINNRLRLYKKCLMACKSGYGKSFQLLYTIRLGMISGEYQNVLILTSYPVLNNQLKKLITETQGFENVNVIINNGSKIQLSENQVNIVLLSLQDVKGGEEIFDKEKFDLIKDINWNLLVIDEVHYGVETDKTNEFLSKIKYEHLIGLSATPTKNLLYGRFTSEETIYYSIKEENEYKKNYPDLYHYPDMNYLIWNLTIEERNILKYFSNEEQFKFDKFFRIENNNFYYKEDIVYLFKKIIGDRSICGKDKLNTKYPLSNKEDFNSIRTVLLFLPNKKVQELLKNLLEKLYSYSDFNIEITNSEINNSEQLMKKIESEYISGDKRCLILAVEQLTTGITLKDCDMVMFMNDWQSVDRYTQASFRCQRPEYNKKNCYVVDFNAGRCFNMQVQYLKIMSNYNNKTLSENISEWIENVNIFNRVEGEFIKVDYDTFNDNYIKSLFNNRTFSTSMIFNDKLIDYKEQLLELNLTSNNKNTIEVLNKDGIDLGKNKKIIKNSNIKFSEKIDDEIEKLRDIAHTLLERLPSLMIYTKFNCDNIDECLKEVFNDNVVKIMFMENLLLGKNYDVSDDIILNLCDNIYDKKILNHTFYIIKHKVNFIYKSMKEDMKDINLHLQDLITLINKYIKPSNTEKRLLGEVFTPLYDKVGCVEDQLNLLPEDFWKDKYKKVLDPCAGIGNYSVVLIDKFMKGLSMEIPNPEERYKWIVENIIYINEFQTKNIFIYLLLFDPDNKYKMNFNKGDYLKLDIKETFGIDKFDLICTNPPYNEARGENNSSKDLYPSMVDKSVKESNEVIMIIPSRWFVKNELSNFRKKMLFNYGMKEICHYDDNKFFENADIKGGVCYFHIDCSYKGEIIFNKEILRVKDLDIIPNEVSKDTFNIISKIKKYENIQHLFNSQGHFNVKTNDVRFEDKGNIKCLVSKQKGGVKYLNNVDFSNKKINTYKIAFPSASGKGGMNENYYNRIEVLEPNVICSESFIFFDFNNIKEANYFKKYMETTFVSYLVRLRKIKQHITSDVFKWVPIVPFDREWTDEMLFDYFELNQNERNIILKYDNK